MSKFVEDADPPRFNLIDEKWIRVRLIDGSTQEMSLIGVFENASGIEALCNDLPTQDFAILRLLIAILERSISPDLDPDDDPMDAWGRLWSARQLPIESITQYLDDWHNRFDLFDEQFPFMQVAGLHTRANSFDYVSKILADVPDGIPFFAMRSGSYLESLSYAEAARWLVHLQAFDPSGIKSGVVGDPSVKGGKSYPIGTGWAGQLGGLYLMGTNLQETILLNFVLSNTPYEDADEFFSEDDLPCWERAPYGPGGMEREPTGYADIYTWQSRRVLLHTSGGRVDGVLVTNGDKLSSQNRFNVEPMTAWRRSTNLEKKQRSGNIFLPMRHQKGRELWRGMDAILPISSQASESGNTYRTPGVVAWISRLSSVSGGRKLDENYPIRLKAVGFVYGTQDSLYEELIDDELTLSIFLISPDGRDADELVRELLSETDSAVVEIGIFARNLHVAAGDHDTTAEGVREDAKREAYFELDRLFRTWLANLDSQSNLSNERDRWRATVWNVLTRQAHELIAQVGPQAFVGHERTIGSKTDWMTAAKTESSFFNKLREILSLGQSINMSPSMTNTNEQQGEAHE